jgi:hypothetical protein
MDIKETLTKLVTIKAKRIPAWDIAFILDNDDFRVAGGCFMDGVPNDYDVYPALGKSFDSHRIKENTIKSLKGEVLCETKNAITVKVHGKVIQFCKYYKTTLHELVESFDFSHCQVGVEFEARETDSGGFGMPEINCVAWSDAWLEYRITGHSIYTGSEYPLSSLIRLNKYVKRDIIKGKSYTIEVLKILNDIIKRGYIDYPDFKNQLDAVDLLLLEPKESNAAYELFKTCHARLLVTRQYSRHAIDNGLLEMEGLDDGEVND